MQKLFTIYVSFLQIGQSETLLRHVFAGLRAFLNNYSIALFKGSCHFFFSISGITLHNNSFAMKQAAQCSAVDCVTSYCDVATVN